MGRPTTSPLSSFGIQLQRWLDHLGVSQAELSRRAEIDVTSITHWMRVGRTGNEREPGYTKVKALADALEITVDQLISGDPERSAVLNVRDAEMRLVFAYRSSKKLRTQIEQLLEDE